jgi:eukaryotic-like serine/threonine-protein kinase
VGETVVVGSCNGLVHGVDKATGTARWTYDARRDGGHPEFHGAPLVAGDVVMLGSDDRRPDGVGHLYAIEAPSGSVRWKTRIGRGSMTDVVRLQDRLYAVTLDNELVALDSVKGQETWSFQGGPPLDPDFANVVATPAVTGDRVYFGGADGVVYALSADSGAVLWKREVGSRIVTPLVLASDALCFGTRDGRLLLADQSMGKPRAEMRLGQMPFGPPTTAGESLLVYSVEGESLVLNAFDLSLAARRWTRRAPRGWSTPRPYLWRGAVLAGDEDGGLAALAVEDGAVVWARQLDGAVRGIGFEGDLLFAGTLKGVVFAVRPPNGKN